MSLWVFCKFKHRRTKEHLAHLSWYLKPKKPTTRAEKGHRETKAVGFFFGKVHRSTAGSGSVVYENDAEKKSAKENTCLQPLVDVIHGGAAWVSPSEASRLAVAPPGATGASENAPLTWKECPLLEARRRLFPFRRSPRLSSSGIAGLQARFSSTTLTSG